MSVCRERLSGRRLYWFLVAVCLAQPVLNAVSFFQDEWSLPNLTAPLRALLLVALALVGFVFTASKPRGAVAYGIIGDSSADHVAVCAVSRWRYILAYGVMGGFWAIHVTVCAANGYEGWFTDLSLFLRVVQLPVTALSFISLLRYDRRCFRALLDGLFGAAALLVIFQILALLTGTEPYTYANKSIGLRGWAYLPSGQSAVLSLLAPIGLYYAARRWKNRPAMQLLAAVVALGYLFLCGTRLSFLCMVLCGVGLAAALFLTGQAKKKAAVLLALTVVFTAMLPISPMYRNRLAVADTAVQKQQLFSDLLDIGEVQAEKKNVSGLEAQQARLEPAYRLTINNMIDRYGISLAGELFDNTQEPEPLMDMRSVKIRLNQKLISQSTPATAWFGLSVERLQCGKISYDCENDLYGLRFLYGWVGLGLLLGMLCWFGWTVLRALWKNAKRLFTPLFAALILAVAAVAAHAVFTGGALRCVDVNFYFGTVLALLYGLTKLDLEDVI